MSDVLGNFIFWTIVLYPIWGVIVLIALQFYAHWGDDE